LILRSKINENGALKNILWQRMPPKDLRHEPITFQETQFLLILIRKINKISTLKNILWQRMPPKDLRHKPITFQENILRQIKRIEL